MEREGERQGRDEEGVCMFWGVIKRQIRRYGEKRGEKERERDGREGGRR